MVRQKRKILLKDVVADKNLESKQFKRPTGSPILYTKLRKHRALYYPLAKQNVTKCLERDHSHRHACVVYSKTYGRELYSNIDIWPDETAKKKLIDKLQGLSLSQLENVRIDIPDGFHAVLDERSKE